MKLVLIVFITLITQLVVAQDNPMFDICPLKVGEQLPEVSVYDTENKEHTLSDLSKDKPTVLIFYRGAWCGYCTKHLAELNDAKKDIESLGYQILGITADQSSKLEESNKRSESEIQVYSDAKLAVIKAFGLDWKVSDETYLKYKEKYQLDLETWNGGKSHELPVPAVFIINKGVVQFQYVNPNYNTRLKAKTLLAILESL